MQAWQSDKWIVLGLVSALIMLFAIPFVALSAPSGFRAGCLNQVPSGGDVSCRKERQRLNINPVELTFTNTADEAIDITVDRRPSERYMSRILAGETQTLPVGNDYGSGDEISLRNQPQILVVATTSESAMHVVCRTWTLGRLRAKEFHIVVKEAEVHCSEADQEFGQ